MEESWGEIGLLSEGRGYTRVRVMGSYTSVFSSWQKVKIYGELLRAPDFPPFPSLLPEQMLFITQQDQAHTGMKHIDQSN